MFVPSGRVPRFLGLWRWQTGVEPLGAALWTSPLLWFYQAVLRPLTTDPHLVSLVFALIQVLAYAAVAWWLDMRRIHSRV